MELKLGHGISGSRDKEGRLQVSLPSDR